MTEKDNSNNVNAKKDSGEPVVTEKDQIKKEKLVIRELKEDILSHKRKILALQMQTGALSTNVQAMKEFEANEAAANSGNATGELQNAAQKKFGEILAAEIPYLE